MKLKEEKEKKERDRLKKEKKERAAEKEKKALEAVAATAKAKAAPPPEPAQEEMAAKGADPWAFFGAAKRGTAADGKAEPEPAKIEKYVMSNYVYLQLLNFD